MDIKKAADTLINDKNPIKAVESATGIDLPDEKVSKVVKEVASKVSVDDVKKVASKLPVDGVKDKVEDVLDKFKG
jgi:hypothetical protein